MPSSVLNSDDGVISGTSGIKAVGGDDGVLVFQSKGTETARINTDKQIVAAAGTASLPIYSTTGDVNTGIYFPAADNIGFATGGTIRGRWTTDGLCFGSDTAAANALDDYEEGTWTPEIADASSGGNTGSASISNATYVKIGKLVTIQATLANIVTTGMTSANVLFIRNLPFTSASPNNSIGPVFTDTVTFQGSRTSAVASIGVSDSWLTFISMGSASTDTGIDVGDLTSGTSDIIITMTYEAA